jgi:Flp pilus assembly protein TadG
MQFSLRKILSLECGTAAVEVAVIFPFIVLLLLGAVDLGVIVERNMTVVDAARTAAQYATMPGISTNLAAIQTVAANSATSIAGFHAVAANVCTCGPGGAVVSCSSTCSGYGTPSEYVTVTTSANLPVLFAVRGLSATIPVQYVAASRVVWTHP